MKLTCPHSGVSYIINSGYGTASRIHPATEVDTSRLIKQLPDYLAGRMSDTDQYLYLLAWFKSLPAVEFRIPADQERDFPILTCHADKLPKLVLATHKFPHLDFPTLIVSKTSTIAHCLKHWIEIHQELLNEQKAKATKQRENAEILRLESALDRITTYHLRSNVTRAAKIVSVWAAKAGNFSNEIVVTPEGTESPLSTYWQQIITLSFSESHTALLTAKITPADLAELIDHCEDYIPHGTLYAHELMKRLRSAQKVLNELTSRPKVYKPVDISNNPEPQRKQFATALEFLKAKARWQSAILASRVEVVDGEEL